ncbi:MAG: DUF167 domain-containing protein [Gammaproteobacteria bacterium]|nr:DUF167 domain-containing protein [Gammaproteobacteria bacterium]
MSPFCRWDGETLILEIRLQPRASDNSVADGVNGRLRIRVTAAPVDNAANRRMIAMLAKEFGVAKSRVRLLAGTSKRDKRVAVESPRRRPQWLPGEWGPTCRRTCARKANP